MVGGRRNVSSAAAAPLLRVTPFSKVAAADPTLIRPPGSLEEPAFLKRCFKCGECMKVCIRVVCSLRFWIPVGKASGHRYWCRGLVIASTGVPFVDRSAQPRLSAT